MNRENIKKKLDEIRDKARENNFEQIKKLLDKDCLQVYYPKKTKFLSSLIFKIRRRFTIEVSHVMRNELEKSKEINLRLLKEIEYIKEKLEKQNNAKETK